MAPTSRRMGFAMWLTLLVFVSLCPCLLYAQGMQNDQMGQMGSNNQAMTVTGCLKQGNENGGFYLKTKDGKVYELSGRADFGKHVGHTVTVSGHEQMNSKAEESKMAPSEKAEAGNMPYCDLHVTTLKHVSDTCPP